MNIYDEKEGLLMRKLFLVSLFQNVSGLLKSVEEVKDKTVTYIPTAS